MQFESVLVLCFNRYDSNGLWKQVWNALKILDASDVDNPEASSGM